MIEMPPQSKKIGLIILAAGGSSRMNGKPKQLLKLQGKTLLRRAAETAINSKFDPVEMVLGEYSGELRKEIDDLPVQIEVNQNWQTGMSSSINSGLSALSEETLAAAGLMLCDQPLITTTILNDLYNAFLKTDALIVASRYENTFGVPAIFSSDLFEELRNLHGDRGAKRIIQKYVNRTTFIEAPEAAFDIDTQADFEGLNKMGFSLPAEIVPPASTNID